MVAAAVGVKGTEEEDDEEAMVAMVLDAGDACFNSLARCFFHQEL